MNELITYLLNEDYEFELKCVSGEPAELSLPIFAGELILRSDGTWNYNEELNA